MGITKNIALAMLAMMISVAANAADKVVVFNVQAAIMQTDAAKKQLATLDSNKEFAKLKSTFESLRAELIELDSKAKTQGITWSDSQKAEHRKQVEYKSADLKLAAEKLKAEQGAVVKSIMQAALPKAKAVLGELIKAEGITVVLDSNAVSWADPNHDITGEVTKRLNKMK